MNEKTKDIITRALWTFLEAFIASLTVTVPAVGKWSSALWSALIAGISAVLSAIKTTAVHTVNAEPAEQSEPEEPAEQSEPDEPEEPEITSTGLKVYLSPSGQYGNVYPVGGTNEGAQCERIAAACAAALEAHGIEAMNGAGKDYDTRVEEATQFSPDLYMPIHTNASKEHNVSGTRMFVRKFSEKTSYDMCKAVFARLDAYMPGLSSNIKEYPDLWEFKNTLQLTAIYAECDFHDVPDVAQFIIDNADKIGETIARGICDGFGIAW